MIANYDSGGHAPSYLYRIVADHYRSEDITL
jgi:translation initiation factor eIF-2B subunit beta